MDFRKTDTAVVFIDPQNDVLSEKGANWGAVGASVTENRTVENMERIFEAAKAHGYDVFISPHYFYPTDNGWKMNGPLEADEFKTHTFARTARAVETRSSGGGFNSVPILQLESPSRDALAPGIRVASKRRDRESSTRARRPRNDAAKGTASASVGAAGRHIVGFTEQNGSSQRDQEHHAEKHECIRQRP